MSTVAVYTVAEVHAAGLRQAVEQAGTMRLEVWPATLPIARYLQRPVDLILVDFDGGGGLEELAAIKEVLTSAKPYVATWAHHLTGEMAAQTAQLGGRGMVRTSLPGVEQARAIERLASGEAWWEKELGDSMVLALQRGKKLTRRQAQIVSLIATGMRNREIAARLFNTEGTVKVYLSHIYRQLGCKGRHELMVWARANGFDQIGDKPPRLFLPPRRAA